MAACLSPQARTQGLFHVFRLDTELFLLLCDGGNREHVMAEFKRFLVADRVSVEDCSDRLSVLHCWYPPVDRQVNVDLGEFISSHYELGKQGAWLGEKVIIPRSRTAYPGCDLVGPKEHTQKFMQRCSKAGAILSPHEKLRWSTFETAIPTFPDVIQENSFFPEARLEQALSFHKGCYVGQEAIERLYALGKLPRELRYYRGDADTAVQPGAPVQMKGDSRLIGEVISSIQMGSKQIIVASIKIESLQDGAQLVVGAVPLTPIARAVGQEASGADLDETPT